MRYVALILESDANGTKYENIYKFFARVAVHTKRCEELHRESKFFRSSFGGSQFERAQRNAASGSSSSASTSTKADKTNPITTTEATTVKPLVPFDRWTPRAQPVRPVVAVMKTIIEDGDENENYENEDPQSNIANQDYVEEEPLFYEPSDISGVSVMKASEKLLKACFNQLTKNSCQVINCEYSHDPVIVAAARDKQIADLQKVKQELQLKHQGTMKAYEQQGSKVVRQGAPMVQRRPLNPEVAPTISLLMQVPGPQVDQHIGREHECYQRIALLSQRIPANILSHGCKMEIVLLCKTKDLVVTSMLDTGCSPGNYMSMAFYKANIDLLEDFLVPGPAERVDLATSDSAQSISLHLVIEARHIDSRGVNRTIKLRFGVLLGLRFDVVIRLYAIALNFMEVMQDLLLLQLEHQEARTHTLAMLYGQSAQLLMMSAADDDDTDQSLDSTETTGPRPPRPPIIAGLTLQTMLRNPWYFDDGQIEDQRAY